MAWYGKIASREVNAARRLHTCRRPCTSEENKKTKKLKKSAPPKTHDETHSNPATAITSRRLDERHPMLAHTRPLPYLPGFGNRPRTAFATSKDDECYTYTLWHRQTETQTNLLNKSWHPVRNLVRRSLYAHRQKTASLKYMGGQGIHYICI